MARLRSAYLKPDGLARTLLTAEGQPLDETSMLYDQAFVMFSLAAARIAGVDAGEMERQASTLRDALTASALPNGAMVEAGDHPFQSNAHMHMLEASMAWETCSDDPQWSALTDRIAHLVMDVFVDAGGGFLREFFSETWRPAVGEDGRLVEPGASVRVGVATRKIRSGPKI